MYNRWPCNIYTVINDRKLFDYEKIVFCFKIKRVNLINYINGFRL